jgi:uncharacterized protein YggU (UPF0235/DUF167 family)
MRVNVRVYPAAGRTEVGGRYGTKDPPVLIVRVHARAVDGRANKAVIEAVALAFGVTRRGVDLIAGRSSRNKALEVTGADQAALAFLLDR